MCRRLRSARAILWTISILYLGAAEVIAQQPAVPASQKQPSESQQDTKTPTRAPVPTARIELAKGTIAQYETILRKAFPRINIVVAPEVEGVQLLPIMLPSIPAGAAVQLLEL